jgi:diaminopimelate epimerase
MRFYKFQALGNDFLIARESELLEVTTDFGAFARRICDRHFGAGADGLEVILERPRVADADFEVRLFNADGGETAISGNGTRCVAAHLYVNEGWLRPNVRIATGAGVRRLAVVERERRRCVFETEMGRPAFASHLIPVNLPAPLEQVVRQPLDVDGHRVEFTSVSMGNPHCSVFVDDFNALDWRRLGAALERHPAFPERTNVEFVRLVSRDEVEVRFWERGVGETLASGTGACGAALAAMLGGLTERKISVRTASGQLAVHWREDGTVLQTGETRTVYAAEWMGG